MLKKYRSTLVKIIPILLLIYVVLSYRDLLRGAVIVPIAYLIFLFRLITGSVHQEILWISFILISIFIAFVSLGFRSDPPPAEIPVETKYPTRLKTWINAVQANQRSEYFKWNLAQDLSNLLIEAIAYRWGLSRADVLRKLFADELNLSAEMAAYLKIAQKPFTQNGFSNPSNGNWRSQIWEKLSRRSTPSQMRAKTPLDLEPDKIIRYLENYLELDPEIWAG